MFFLAFLAAQSDRLNFLESCVRAYIDNAGEALLLSSGLEDYFLGTYFFNRGTYHTEIAGLTHLNKEDHTFSAYRFHEEDPLFLSKGLRLTLRCGEKTDSEHGKHQQLRIQLMYGYTNGKNTVLPMNLFTVIFIIYAIVAKNSFI